MGKLSIDLKPIRGHVIVCLVMEDLLFELCNMLMMLFLEEDGGILMDLNGPQEGVDDFGKGLGVEVIFEVGEDSRDTLRGNRLDGAGLVSKNHDSGVWSGMSRLLFQLRASEHAIDSEGDGYRSRGVPV